MRSVVAMLLVVLFVSGTRIILNRTPVALISIQGVSPQEVIDRGWSSSPATGLDVVGVGDLVYLTGAEVSGEEVLSYGWSVSDAPVGSVVTVDSTDAQWFTFRPDVEGVYTISLTISTASGASSTSVEIVAATYVGIGIMGGAAPTFAAGQCGSCHSTLSLDFMQTGHASKFTREIDGQGSTAYNSSCIRCHTVGYNEDPEALNAGFDDLAADLGWAFPDALQDGNWTDIVDNYPELAQLTNIQCENCHGPGSLHTENTSKIDLSLNAQVCAKCHEEAPYHVRPSQWKTSRHASGSSFAYAGGRVACAGCHNGFGFIENMDPASQLDQTIVEAITCAVCHDPHNASGDHQLREAALGDVELLSGEIITRGGTGKLCMTCHKSRRDAENYVKMYRSHYGPHHGPQADMLAGTNAITFGRVLPNSTHKDVLPNTCVSCHMFETPTSGEPGHNTIGDHSFKMTHEGTDLVAVCQSCHEPGMVTFEDRMSRKDHDEDGQIEGAQAEIIGLLDLVGNLLPPLGDPAVEVTPDYNLLQLKAAYNYLFVEEDRSLGVHNFQYAVSLLLLTRDALNYDVLTEGAITSVADVPNDQGRQVSVEWTRFGGDGGSNNPVQVYYVWRNDGVITGKQNATYSSLSVVPVETDEYASVMFAGEIWTQVGQQPTVQMDDYRAVVPTLFDSTNTGVVLSEFMVTGHTAISAIYAASDPATGYSIDNIAPLVPASVVATPGETGILIQWEESADADFNYFAIYRGTEEGFIPDAAEPYATLTSIQFTDSAVDQATVYYYKVAAYDFSGNQGAYSDEVYASMATVSISISIETGWEMIGSPLTMADMDYQVLFPTALGNTFFAFTGTYSTPDPPVLSAGGGYWLRFVSSGTNTLVGLPVNSVVLNLALGWNMISPPNCSMPFDSITDPNEILLAGTLYGFDGQYVQTATLEPGLGYWIRTTSAGAVTMDCSAVSQSSKDYVAEMGLESFRTLTFNDAGGQRQILYFSGELPSEAHPMTFTIPPNAPGQTWRVAFDGGRYLSEKEEETVSIEGATFPLNVRLSGRKSEMPMSIQALDADGYVLELHTLLSNQEALVINAESVALRLSEAAEIPSDYALEQNYPNPFNPATTIRFALPEETEVTLDVFDMLGRKVATLLDGRSLEVGLHEVQFDARGLASGTYLYRIKAGLFTKSMKLVVMK